MKKEIILSKEYIFHPLMAFLGSVVICHVACATCSFAGRLPDLWELMGIQDLQRRVNIVR